MGRTRFSKVLRIVCLAALVVALPAAAATSTGSGSGSGLTHRQLERAAVDAALSAAAEALIASDPSAWDAALPTEAGTAESRWRDVYTHLSRYTWSDVQFDAAPVDGVDDAYFVTARGRLRDSDVMPIVCQCLLRLSWSSGHVTLQADLTPARRRHDHYLAFAHPLVIAREHLVVVGGRRYGALISRVAAGDGEVNRVIRRLRLDRHAPEVDRKTVVLVCGSRRQAARASASPMVQRSVLAFEQSGSLYFVAYTPSDWAGEVRGTIRHELTHSFASEFGQGEHYAGLLAEGLAVAVEGDESCDELRAELARGRLTLPLMEALTQQDIWQGRTGREVTLAYQEGGTLVSYVEARWSLGLLKEFAQAVADSDMTPAGIRRACAETLGVPWNELHSGWKRFVLAPP